MQSSTMALSISIIFFSLPDSSSSESTVVSVSSSSLPLLGEEELEEEELEEEELEEEELEEEELEEEELEEEDDPDEELEDSFFFKILNEKMELVTTQTGCKHYQLTFSFVSGAFFLPFNLLFDAFSTDMSALLFADV